MTDTASIPAEGIEQYAIGISFGNSYSSIAHISGEGKVEVIANEEGDRQIPTALSYVEGEEYHGTQAKSQLIRNSKNTIAYFRDYLGKSYKEIDPTPCQGSAHPVDNNGPVVFEVVDNEAGDSNKISVSEATTRHIRRLKASATDFSGKNVTSAVVTVPTDFTDAQKAALTKAAGDAGVQVLQYIPEPIAAVLAYDARSSEIPSDNVVVVADFGGLRSDVAVVASRGGMYSILATAHDYELGGAALDNVLIEFFAKEFEKKNKIDARKNERGVAKLKAESEAVKKALSQSTTATFTVESLADGLDFRSTINRTRYDLVAGKIHSRFARLIDEVVKKAQLDVLDVDEVILSGGSSHTPKIASTIANLFPESTQIHAPSTSATALNPSELAARGAAIQASLIQDFDKEDIDQSTHEGVTVTPHLTEAIGVQITGQASDSFSIVIPQNAAVPAKRTVKLPAPAGDVLLRICEGEREIKITKPEPKPKTNGAKAENNDDDDDDDEDFDSEEEEEDIREKVWRAKKPLAEVALKGLQKGAKIEVTINVGADLALSVTAREVGGKGGVRGNLNAPQTTQNGKA